MRNKQILNFAYFYLIFPWARAIFFKIVAKPGKCKKNHFFCRSGLYTSWYKIYQEAMRFWQLFGILVHPTVKEPKCCKILAWHLKRKKIHIVCTCLKSKILIPAYFWNCWISFNPHMSHFIQCNPSRPARSQISPPSPWQESHFMQARLTLSPYFCVCNSFHHWPTLCLFGRNGAY